jgi:lipopolysaccharide transport system ATP-binding protein
MADTLIKVENVSKKFCRSLKKSLWYGIQDLGKEITGRQRTNDQLRDDEFWAVKDVSFELRRGECLGLIGRNGAGKTTLLRMLNGLIKPDHGRIEMHGRIGALIALGAGFNPLLSGRENIYVNAAILGLKKTQVDKHLDEIIDFSGVAQFIDAPVQTYSTGMNVRLGFSIATTLNPDVLILDEVLAVGDASFRQKCLHRVSSLLDRAAVVFVSHSASEISRVCSTGLLLENGTALFYGRANEALNIYEKNSFQEAFRRTCIFADGAYIDVDAISSPTNQVPTFDKPLNFSFPYTAQRSFIDCLIVLTFSHQGVYVLQCHDVMSIPAGAGRIKLHVPRVPLGDGEYSLSLTIMEYEGKFQIVTLLDFKQISILGRTTYGIPSQANLTAAIES